MLSLLTVSAAPQEYILIKLKCNKTQMSAYDKYRTQCVNRSPTCERVLQALSDPPCVNIPIPHAHANRYHLSAMVDGLKLLVKLQHCYCFIFSQYHAGTVYTIVLEKKYKF